MTNIKIINYIIDPKGTKIGYVDIFVDDGDRSFFLSNVAHFKKEDGSEYFRLPSFKRGGDFAPVFHHLNSIKDKELLEGIKEPLSKYFDEKNPPVADAEVPF